MATTDVEIANLALLELGQPTITALNDGSFEATKVNQRFASSRLAVLRAFPWNFAIKRVALSTTTTAPVYGYSNAFALPSDWVRFVAPEELGDRWRIEARTILSNEVTVRFQYVADITDVTKMDDLFKEAWIAHLAMELCNVFEGDLSKRDRLERAYLAKLNEATHVDAAEAPVTAYGGAEWVNARHGVDVDLGPFVQLE